MGAIALGGPALHAGGSCAVVLVRRPGPLAFRQHGVETALDDLRVERTDQGVAVSGGGVRVDLVEHLCAAIGGLGIGEGLRVDVFGPEVPLLDGGASRFACALRQLHVPACPRRVRIVKPAVFRLGGAEYRFAPSDQTRLCVEVEFDHPLVEGKRAEWLGGADDFLERIAPARTFGFRRDAVRLRAAGRARSVDVRSVVVLEDDGTSVSEPPPGPDECVRHKLLDLMGDLTVAGGVPRGVIEARRPGHGATDAVMSMAWAQGVLSLSPALHGAG